MGTPQRRSEKLKHLMAWGRVSDGLRVLLEVYTAPAVVVMVVMVSVVFR